MEKREWEHPTHFRREREGEGREQRERCVIGIPRRLKMLFQTVFHVQRGSFLTLSVSPQTSRAVKIVFPYIYIRDWLLLLLALCFI